MAFTFNWSPLTADASFYTRAQELLTTALNKSPKPPIIVDDILVNELNLGSVPPDLEILEIGDLAEDRFRGIFKMCYTGDAFLTLKTRVQVCSPFTSTQRRVTYYQKANPLNTYLSTKPLFASPLPLAAASGLTIPLKITLSDIKLSAFIILVFSKQKGLTLVFRNDPLESLKVSSTFDSIPFVRDYLQKEIEGQLRTLLMDEVPAIIHRLSLRLWVPEFRAREDAELSNNTGRSATQEKITDPLATPPQDPVDLFGNALDAAQIASLSLDSGAETHSLFSQKNLLRLAALTNSHRTLSLFTPGMRDVVYRAWAGQTEREEHPVIGVSGTSLRPGFSKMHSPTPSASTSYTFSDGSDQGPYSVRPSLISYGSSFIGHNFGHGKHGKPSRKRKHRIVNLRKPKIETDDLQSNSGESSMSATISSATSESEYLHSEPVGQEGELITPPNSPPNKTRLQRSPNSIDLRSTPPRLKELTPRQPVRNVQRGLDGRVMEPSIAFQQPSSPLVNDMAETTQCQSSRQGYASQNPQEKAESRPSLNTTASGSFLTSAFPYAESSPGGILEQAWMMKMAGEIARRVREDKASERSIWDRNERDDTPPPAYGS